MFYDHIILKNLFNRLLFIDHKVKEVLEILWETFIWYTVKALFFSDESLFLSFQVKKLNFL